MDDKDVLFSSRLYPYFYVKIPEKWKSSKVDKFMDFVKTKVWGKYQYGLIDYDVVSNMLLVTADANFKFID